VIAIALNLTSDEMFQASDLPANHWGSDYVSALKSIGVLKGFPDGTFQPYAPTTRAQFAAVLVRSMVISEQGTE
jgi:hypothetical protein